MISRRTWLVMLGLVTGVALHACPPAVAVEDAAAACRALAGDPTAGPGMPIDQIDADQALMTCADALGSNPAAPDLQLAQARALERAGEIEQAARLYEWAADSGNPAAAFALARLYRDGRMSPPDPQAVERLLAQAAAAGYAPDAMAVQAGDAAPALGAFAAAAAADPETLRQQIAALGLESYPGILRGPEATIRAGGGGPDDKAYLLWSLLQAKGLGSELRWAECELDELSLRAIQERASSWGRPRQVLIAEGAADAVPLVQDPDARRLLEAIAATWADANRQATGIADELTAQLLAAGIERPLGRVAEVPDALRRHGFVQIFADGNWRDLDVLDPDRADAPCKASARVPQPPDEWFAVVGLHVVLEERQDTGTAERALLEHEVRLADLASGISLHHAEPFGEPGGMAPPAGMQGYTPVLRIGEARVVGSAFPLRRPASAPAAGSMAGLGDALTDVFSTDGPAAPAPPVLDAEAAEDRVLAEFLDVRVRLPGRPEITHRITVFDRLGVVGRARGKPDAAPLEETDEDYRALSGAVHLAFATGATPAPDDSPAGDDLALLLQSMGRLNGAHADLRRALVDAMLGDGASGSVELDLPVISVLRWTPSRAGAPPAASDLVMDLAMDRVRSPGTAPGLPPAWAAASLVAERLVVETNRLLERLAPDNASDLAAIDPARVDVARIFAAAQRDSVPVRRWDPGDRGPVAGIEASAEAKLRLAAALDAGATVLAPERAVLLDGQPWLGWWRLDPDNAVPRDELENGLHMAATEHAQTNKVPEGSARSWRVLGRKIFCWANGTAAAIAMALGVANGDPGAIKAGTDYAKNIAKIIEAEEKQRQAGQQAAKVAGQCKSA